MGSEYQVAMGSKATPSPLSPKGAREVNSNYLSARLSEQHWGEARGRFLGLDAGIFRL
jgi:hypothetical protein